MTAYIAALAGVSCSAPVKPNDRKPVFPVRGQLLFQNRPAAGAFVLFIPVKEPAEVTDPRPRATVGPDGSFTLSTYDPDDGAPPGDYIVTVTWPGGDDPEDRFQGRYADRTKSRLRAKVMNGPTDLPPMRLP